MAQLTTVGLVVIIDDTQLGYKGRYSNDIAARRVVVRTRRAAGSKIWPTRHENAAGQCERDRTRIHTILCQ